ncbi:hypothetical protein Tco_0213735, partial [Tanacetum coccineum]
KQISDKRKKNQEKTDKTEHGMEKRGKAKVKSKPKSKPRSEQKEISLLELGWRVGLYSERLLTNEMMDTLSVEPSPHLFKKKSLISMGVVMELQNGECFWPIAREVMEEDNEGDEAAGGDAGHEGARGSADIRTAKKIEEINNFQQEPDETLFQAWERFKELLMKYPQHYLTEIQEICPEDIKVPLILGRPFLSTARAKIDVYKRKITLRVGEENIIFKSVKSASSLIKRVYMLNLRERMELDLEARLMRETLVRNQRDDLMPTIEEWEVIEEFRTRDDELDTEIDDYRSYCDSDKKIHIDCAHNLKFSCMIGFEFTHVNFFLLLYVNVMSKKFHNSIMKDKMVYKGNNVVGTLMNVPIFFGTFSVVSDFAVMEDMDAYHDEGMGDVIFGEPFLREVRIETKQFEGMITILQGDDEVSEKDEKNGISHAYQKLKRFYKGVLNLGPDYIRNAKTEEWLIRGYISVHEME